MTILIFGPTELIGQELIHLALTKNYKVKAFGRNVESLIDKDLRNDSFEAIKGYVFNEQDVKNVVKKADYIISCLHSSNDITDKTLSLGFKNIIAQATKYNIRKMVVLGHYAVLNDANGNFIFETENFEEEDKHIALENYRMLQMLENSSINYTLVCPYRIINSTSSANYIITTNHYNTNTSNGINVKDLAHCILDCIEADSYTNKKIGLAN